ncbi:MAG: hypothetical protein AB1424_02710 [Thermodesulfobacteriota bacterium]
MKDYDILKFLTHKWKLVSEENKLQHNWFKSLITSIWVIQGALLASYRFFLEKYASISLLLSLFGLIICLSWIRLLQKQVEVIGFNEDYLRHVEIEIEDFFKKIDENELNLHYYIYYERIFSEKGGKSYYGGKRSLGGDSQKEVIKKNNILDCYLNYMSKLIDKLKLSTSVSYWVSALPKIIILLWVFLLIFAITQID